MLRVFVLAGLGLSIYWILGALGTWSGL
jgi:hypothetical protein